jgi:hypothetical protein
VEVEQITIESNAEPDGSYSNGKYSVIKECNKSDIDDPYCKPHIARILDVATGLEVFSTTYEGWLASAVISSEGKYVAAGGCDEIAKIGISYGYVDKCIRGTARVSNIKTGVESAHLTNEGEVTAVAFSPDSQYVVSGGCDEMNNKYICIKGIARVFEAATGVEVARMIYDDEVAFVSFSTDGKYVISGSYGGSARKWIYLPEDLIAEACSRVTRNLTRTEWNQYIGDALPYQAVCPNLPIEAESTPVP